MSNGVGHLTECQEIEKQKEMKKRKENGWSPNEGDFAIKYWSYLLFDNDIITSNI